MHFDTFFSISQTPVRGQMPSEREMFGNFLRQVQAADELGFGTAWIAESHLSSEVQKHNPHPVIPHWQGEVGLNVDFLQLAQRIFHCTERIEVGSAIMNILVNGGPVAAAERVAAFLTLHGLDTKETRQLHVGFAAGRFEFMNRAAGIVPRSAMEEAAWPVLKGRNLAEATEVFLRLLRGDILSSADIAPTWLTRQQFRSDADWQRVQQAAETQQDRIEVPTRWVFDKLKIIPQDWRRDLLTLTLGSHEAALQEAANNILPVQIFNLSITQPAIIEDTHERMRQQYHPDGGAWHRRYMPRTVFVFLNEQSGLTPESRRQQARQEAHDALGAYWTALEGTLNPSKVAKATDNAVVGNAEDVSQQILERFHPDDRLMLWFDFFNHDCGRIIENMQAFMQQVAPRVQEAPQT